MIQHLIDQKVIYFYLEEIQDPEVPVLSIIDLGIVRVRKQTRGKLGTHKVHLGFILADLQYMPRAYPNSTW